MPIPWKTVTLVDAEGNTSVMDAPQFGSEDAPAFWTPVFDGIRELVEDLNWSEDALHFGVFGDSWASSQAIRDFFEQVAPDIRWAMFTHARGHPNPTEGELRVDGWEIGYRVLPYRPDYRRFPQERFLGGFLKMGWDQPFFQLADVAAVLE